MKYIIMCGGEYKDFETPKQLLKVNDEIIVERTIRLLKENGITDIAISTNNPAFDYLKIEKLRHENNFIHEYKNEKAKGWWLDAFYPTDEPTCYIWGDVFFSEEAIKTIVEAKTSDIELFGSMPPFAYNYPKKWIEPFALKVANTEHLWVSIEKTKKLALEGKTWRENPIVWELWTVIKNVPLETKPDEYIYNYTAINDYTSDIDNQRDIDLLILKIGGVGMVKVQCIVNYNDLQLNKLVTTEDEPFFVTKERADYLANERGLVKIIEVIPDEVKEEAKPTEEVKETPKAKPKRTKKK